MIVDILYILLAIALLGVLVMVHEFGHYIVGRLTGHDRAGIFHWLRAQTPGLEAQGRRLLPARRAAGAAIAASWAENENVDDPRAMNRQPVWRRFLTSLAGPLMNFIFAFIVCVVMLMGYFTAGVSSPTVESVYADYPAAQAGMQAGDVIVEAGGVPIEFFRGRRQFAARPHRRFSGRRAHRLHRRGAMVSA